MARVAAGRTAPGTVRAACVATGTRTTRSSLAIAEAQRIPAARLYPTVAYARRRAFAYARAATLVDVL